MAIQLIEANMNTLTGLPRSLRDLAMTKDFIIWGGVGIRPQKFLILAGAEKTWDDNVRIILTGLPRSLHDLAMTRRLS